MAERPTTQRLTHLDNLKTMLVAWIIAGHALLGYSAVGGWAYDEINEVTLTPRAELILAVLLGSSGLFVIGVFFFIAGLLTPGALGRKGTGRYVRGRVLRLGLPWLVSAALLWPGFLWLANRAAGRPVSYWWVLTHRDPMLDAGALWFAAVLLVYSVCFAAWCHTRPERTDRLIRPLAGQRLVALVLVLVAATFAVRLWFPARSSQIGDLHLWQWPQCVAMFALGVAASRRGWANRVPARASRGSAVVVMVTIALLPVLALLAGVGEVPLAEDVDPFLGGWRWQALATATVEAVLVVAGSVWLLAAAQRHLSIHSRRSAAWARAAYAAFILQGPVLLTLATAVRPVPVPAELKATLVAAAGIAACFWLGALVVTRTRLGRVL